MEMQSTTELLEAGRAHYISGRLQDAEACYRKATESGPQTVNARIGLGNVLHDLGRMQEAAEVLGQLVVERPKLALGWVHLARVVAAGGFKWEAHQALRKGLKLHPDADTLVTASGVFLTLQDCGAAESACRRALKKTPNHVQALIHLGRALAADDRHEDALAAFERALTFDPDNRVAAFFRAALKGSAGPTAVPPEYVRELFDEYAGRFDGALVGLLQYRTPEMLQRMLAQWIARDGATAPRQMAMLDVGCGTGLCGMFLAQYRGRLVGIDLVPRMIAEARARGVYDELVLAEAVDELRRRTATVDLIVAADVLVYLGDLTDFFAAAATALRVGGALLVSVEAAQTGEFVLLPTQRFAHSMDYLQRLAGANQLAIRMEEEAVIRTDHGKDILGYLVLMEKTR
jgi:predicted TPR repeat methyltransferase